MSGPVNQHACMAACCMAARRASQYGFEAFEAPIFLLREGPSPRGAPSVSQFPISIPEKRLDLKSLKGRIKAEELWHQLSQLLSLRPPLKAL